MLSYCRRPIILSEFKPCPKASEVHVHHYLSLTSLHPLIMNSLNDLISSIKIFMRRNFSLKPTNRNRPLGCIAML